MESRSTPFDRRAFVDTIGDGVMTVHQGPIMSQTISHREPHVVADHLESTLVGLGIAFRKISSLLYQTSMPKFQVTVAVEAGHGGFSTGRRMARCLPQMTQRAAGMWLQGRVSGDAAT
jgi:hypothetical protein